MHFLLALLLSNPDGGGTALQLRALTVTGFEAAAVETFDGDAFFGKVTARSLTARRGEVTARVVELAPTRVRRLDGYLAAWRKHHGCTAKEVQGLPALRRGATTPPQLTFGGVCEGGDTFLIRVVALEGVAYELHVDAPALGGADLRPAMEDLLERVELR